ncbi:MAG: glycosyltransferase [Cytophagales bacterium]|nr:MAG: glycosyltransferase [Cytophagales bacterium]TAF61870.1 MAG: glycosyltransferase [Cytophagales bacterium]
MNVLHINTYDRAGGAEQFAYDLTHFTSLNNHLGVKRKQTNSSKTFVVPRNKRSYLQEYTDKAFYKLFKRTLLADIGVLRPFHGTEAHLLNSSFYQEADVVNFHNLHFDYFDLKALLTIAKQKPFVWSLHDLWSVTGGETYTFENENFKKGLPDTPYNKLHPLLHPLIDRRAACMAAKKAIYQQLSHNLVIVVPCKWLGQNIREAAIVPKEARIVQIQYGINTELVSNENRRTWPLPRVLFINTSNPFKGARLVKQILGRLEGKFELHVVGDPLPEFPDAVHLPRIQNDRTALNQLYNSIDVMIFPSEAENSPLTTMEAMTAGVLVVASSAGGIPEQVGEAGLIFEKSNAEGLLKVLNQVLAMPLADIRAHGQAAQIRAEKKFSLNRLNQDYTNLYQNLLSERTKGMIDMSLNMF